MATSNLISITCTSCSTVLCISTNSFRSLAGTQITPHDTALFSNCGLVPKNGADDGLDRGLPTSALTTRLQECKLCGKDVGSRYFLSARREGGFGGGGNPGGDRDGDVREFYVLDLTKVTARSVLTQEIVPFDVIKSEDSSPLEGNFSGLVTPWAGGGARRPEEEESNAGASSDNEDSASDGNISPSTNPTTPSAIEADSRDFDGFETAVNDLKADLTATRDELRWLKAEQGGAAARANEDVSDIRNLVDDLRTDLAATRDELAQVKKSQAEASTKAKDGVSIIQKFVDGNATRNDIVRIETVQAEIGRKVNDDAAAISSVATDLRADVTAMQEAIAETKTLQAQAAAIQGDESTMMWSAIAETKEVQIQAAKSRDDSNLIWIAIADLRADVAAMRERFARITASQSTADTRTSASFTGVWDAIGELKMDIGAIKDSGASPMAMDSRTSAVAGDICPSDETVKNEPKSDVEIVREDMSAIMVAQSQAEMRETQLAQRIVSMTGDVCRITSRLGETDALRREVLTLRNRIHRLEGDGVIVLGEPGKERAASTSGDPLTPKSDRKVAKPFRSQRQCRSSAAPGAQETKPPSNAQLPTPPNKLPAPTAVMVNLKSSQETVLDNSTVKKISPEDNIIPSIEAPEKITKKRLYSEALGTENPMGMKTASSRTRELRSQPRPSYRLKRRHQSRHQNLTAMDAIIDSATEVLTAVKIP